jgi:hypothetical protein
VHPENQSGTVIAMTASAQQITALTPRQIAAQKAWVTMRARKAALAATAAPVAITPAVDVPAAPRQVIHNISTSADLVVNVYRPPVLEPVTEFRYVSIHLVDSNVGSGIREFVPLAMSSRDVRLFYPPSLECITIHRQEFDRNAVPVPPRRYSRARLAAAIRRRIALADRINDRDQATTLTDGGAEAQTVLQMIGE